MEAFIAIAQQFGIPLAIVLFFIWRDWKREAQLSHVIEGKDTLITAQTAQIAEMIAAVTRLATNCEDALREASAAATRQAEVSQAMLNWLRENGGSGAHRALSHA